MFERFTDRSRRVTVLSQEEARLLNHDWIGIEHFLLGFVHEGEGVAAQALADVGVGHLDGLRASIQAETTRAGSVPSGHIPFTPDAKKMLESSLREALQLGHNYIGTEHMLLAFAKVLKGHGLDSPSGRVLLTLGVTPDEIRQAVIKRLSNYVRQDVQTVPPAQKVLEQTSKIAVHEGDEPKSWVTVDREQLIDAAEDYLVSLRTALWGQAYDMFQKDSRRAAAEFVTETVLGVVQRLEGKD